MSGFTAIAKMAITFIQQFRKQGLDVVKQKVKNGHICKKFIFTPIGKGDFK